MRNQRLAAAVLLLAAAVLAAPQARGGLRASVEPASISAGTFYGGATLQVRGEVAAGSQVAVRVLGPARTIVLNRRDRIAGFMWGGVEHVTFENAPGLYALFTSGALASLSGPSLRARLLFGYDTLEARIGVKGTRVSKSLMLEHFVRLAQKDGLYRIAPGAVRLEDARDGRHRFSLSVPLPATTPPGELEVATFELAHGEVLASSMDHVRLAHAGLPAFLFELAHRHATLYGLLSLLVLSFTGSLIALASRTRVERARKGKPNLLLAVLQDLWAGLSAPRLQARSAQDVARLQSRYHLFRTLLALNNELLEMLAGLEEESMWTSYGHPRVRQRIRALFDGAQDLVEVLNELTANRYGDLVAVVQNIRRDATQFLAATQEQPPQQHCMTLAMSEISSKTAWLVGGKAINLARLECDLGQHVPGFFVVTTEAYRAFIENEELGSRLAAVLAPARLDSANDFRRRCEMAQELIAGAEVPETVGAAIRAGYRAAGFPTQKGVAVRSSATGEDGELSFAGQFDTILNVPEEGIVDAWKRVVRSRFSERAVFYRRATGLAEVDTPMAVLVQEMVEPRASGVLFSRRPDDPAAPVLLVSAVSGLGADVSTGIAEADELVISRRPPHPVVQRRIARKAGSLQSALGGGLTQVPIAAGEQFQSALTDDEVRGLAQAALAIERYFDRPQDIEWSLSKTGERFILQSRPLRTEKAATYGDAVPAGAPLLLRGGQQVWPGRAVGPVHLARSSDEEDRLPAGALLVVHQLKPDCVRLLPRVCGIVAEHGSVIGHAASIVREFRVPTLFGLRGATDTLLDGQLVSLDAASGSVFQGALWPGLQGHLPVTVLGRHTAASLPEPLYGRLTQLTDTTFVGSWACRSIHDVIRYAHEMAIQSMFDIGDTLLDSNIGGVKKLDMEPSGSLYLLDLGGGLQPQAGSRSSVSPDDVVSVPFRGLWRGLGDRYFEPRRLGARALGSLASLATNTAVGDVARPLGTPNYACVTNSYLNLNSRQAFHFATVDAFLSENQNNNHVSLRLKGGGAAAWQRELRGRFVSEVLRRHHFTVAAAGDLVNGWCRNLDPATGADKLAMLGHLLRFSAQLDLWLTDESQLTAYVDAFADSETRAARRAAEGPGSPPLCGPRAEHPAGSQAC